MSTRELSIPAEALELHEAGLDLTFDLTEALEGRTTPAGAIPVVVIRPGMGNAAHRHYYGADMLRENAEAFSGWPMYVDHLSAQARKALGGLPRSMRDLGGVITESWWTDSILAEGKHEGGAVVGFARPIGYMKEVVGDAPELVRTSISAKATGVRPATVKGQRMFVVEGIANDDDNRGSVDWVTQAGAGGRVLGFIAEAAARGNYGNEFLATLDDDGLIEWVQENRPELAEALDLGSGHPSKEEQMEITAEQLSEALTTPEGRAILIPVVKDILESEDTFTEIVEARLDEEREIIGREAGARADRRIALYEMRDEAHAKIDEAKLPGGFADRVKAEFDIVEGLATPALNQIDDLDDDLNVVKTAREKLGEAVTAKIEESRTLAASVAPTRVRGQGLAAGRSTERKEGAEGGNQEEQPKLPKVTSDFLTEAGFSDPDKVYETPSRA